MGNTSTKSLTCKHCNKDFVVTFTHTQGGFSSCNKKYCSKECKGAKRREKSISSVTLKCNYCERDYTLPPSLAKHSKYCSRACQNRSYAKSSEKERVTLTCSSCGANFEVIEGSNRKYCSLPCARDASRTATRVIVPCKVCGSNFEKYSTSVVRFCGRKCQYAAQSSGEIKLYSRGRAGVRSDLGIYFRSSLEADYFRYCNHVGIEVHYEHKTFSVKVAETEASYTPDFFHPATNEYVELKAGRRDHAFEKNLLALEVLKADGLNIRVLYMKDFYSSLKTQELFDVIPNLEFRNYKGTKNLVVNSRV